MALPSLAELKAYLRRDTTAEDSILTSILASAVAQVEAYLDNPITAAEKVVVDEGVSNRPTHMLMFSYYPISDDAVTVEDADGVEIPTTDYRINRSNGLIRAKNGRVFDNFPYTITATAGWSADEDYATRVEPVLRQAILDVAAELYAQRNAGASSEAAGSGVMATYGLRTIPPRVERALQPFRRRWVA